MRMEACLAFWSYKQTKEKKGVMKEKRQEIEGKYTPSSGTGLLHLIKRTSGNPQADNATNGFQGSPGVLSQERQRSKNKHMTTAA